MRNGSYNSYCKSPDDQQLIDKALAYADDRHHLRTAETGWVRYEHRENDYRWTFIGEQNCGGAIPICDYMFFWHKAQLFGAPVTLEQVQLIAHYAQFAACHALPGEVLGRSGAFPSPDLIFFNEEIRCYENISDRETVIERSGPPAFAATGPGSFAAGDWGNSTTILVQPTHGVGPWQGMFAPFISPALTPEELDRLPPLIYATEPRHVGKLFRDGFPNTEPVEAILGYPVSETSFGNADHLPSNNMALITFNKRLLDREQVLLDFNGTVTFATPPHSWTISKIELQKVRLDRFTDEAGAGPSRTGGVTPFLDSVVDRRRFSAKVVEHCESGGTLSCETHLMHSVELLGALPVCFVTTKRTPCRQKRWGLPSNDLEFVITWLTPAQVFSKELLARSDPDVPCGFICARPCCDKLSDASLSYCTNCLVSFGYLTPDGRVFVARDGVFIAEEVGSAPSLTSCLNVVTPPRNTKT